MSATRKAEGTCAWVLVALTSACVGPGGIASETDSTSGTGIMLPETSTGTSMNPEGSEIPDLDTSWDDPPPPPPPSVQIDVLIVVDNSATMGEEQQKLATAAPQLFDSLAELTDPGGDPLELDINVMVTSTDMGHPLCVPPDGYEPKQGAPEGVPCVERLADFTSQDGEPIVFPEACESVCPDAVTPAHPFVHVEGPNGATTNVPGNQVKAALACLVPQGINGCGYEAPLEAMLQALNPDAAWNQGVRPFLRDGALLAIVMVSDEADCSVRPPDGYAYFVDPNLDSYWEVNPDTGTKTEATSAVCWNAGVDCGMPDMNGVYADCTAVDNEVLHPTARYVDYLVDVLGGQYEKELVMLMLSGVPVDGGLADLVYHEWIDGAYPGGDILPGDDAATNGWLYGIGPGCTAEDGMGGFHGQAIPPVREVEVCQALDKPLGRGDATRCCIDSICDSDYDDAITCLTGMLQTVIWEL